ncbi:MAG TPA: long-chain-fatty-acid--CoA ligase [Actinomycetales bacterium]|nr:long-chain-fatty-acid--CoA ligase [Actinomycetales bacterium]
MIGTMRDAPLLVSRILTHGGDRHAASTVTGFDSHLRPQTARFEVIAARSAATAHALAELGVGEGDVVAVLSGNRTEFVEALFAVPSMGAVALPVNIRLPHSTIVALLRDAGVSVLLADPLWAALAGEAAGLVESIRHLVLFGAEAPDPVVGGTGAETHALESLLDGRATTYPWPDLDERAAAVVSHTSGTTGSPKAVAYTHRSIWLHSMQMCMAECSALQPADTVLTTIPCYHVMAWGLPHASFLSGSSLVMARPRPPESLPSGREVATLLATFRPTKAATTPIVLAGLLRHLDEHPQPLGHLREVLVGGSAVPPALFDAFSDRHGITVIQAYGLTETSPVVAAARPDPRSSATERREQVLSQGRFPAGVEARLVDGGMAQPHDGATVGELQLRGPWITARYLDDPDDTGGRFEDGWLRTGDMATISPKGFLTVVDRVDDIILSGGEWISTVELENAVMLDDRVAEAAVIGVPDDRWGHRPLVVVHLKPGATATARSLWEALEGEVDLWKRPDHWAFVDEIPRTSVGKYDKRAIRGRHTAGSYRVTTIAPGATG